MADYWKSQPRHFCEICKCWMAANKVSREMHEQGSRHKVNVAKKITETSKNRGAEETRKREIDKMLEQMNRGALEGMVKDLSHNPTIVSKYGSKVQERVEGKDMKSVMRQLAHKERISGLPEGWYQYKTENGTPYYWNEKTNESSWQRPGETGPTITFPSDTIPTPVQIEKEKIAQIIKEKVASLDKKITNSEETKNFEESKNSKETKNCEGVKNELTDEKVQSFQTQKEEGAEANKSFNYPSNPYGRWQVVKQKSPFSSASTTTEESNHANSINEFSSENPSLTITTKSFSDVKRKLPSNENVSFKKRKQSNIRSLRSRDDE